MTTVHEIASHLYRISTPVEGIGIPGGFSFNQFLVVDDAPLLFHTGPRRMFPLVREAVTSVLGDAAKLRYVAFSHVEADEMGSLDLWLATAPTAEAVCSMVAKMVSTDDLVDRPAVGLADGQELALGKRSLRWLDAPHVPHGWDCGYLFDASTKTLLCGDLFTQAGSNLPPLTESEVLGPSEVMRSGMDYFAHGPQTRATLDKLARTEPTTLACMHGSSYRGNGAALLRGLADKVA